MMTTARQIAARRSGVAGNAGRELSVAIIQVIGVCEQSEQMAGKGVGWHVSPPL